MHDFKPWRPRSLDEFEGQQALKLEIAVELAACKRHFKPLPSMFLWGPPGLGKSTLADILAAERDVPILKLTGEGLKHDDLTRTLIEDFFHLGARKGYDVQGRLIRPEEAIFPILLLDECEKVPKGLMEICHTLLEPDNADGIPMFQARYPETGELFRAWTPRFTFVWLTNFAGDVALKSQATLSRFKINRQFQWYTNEQALRVVLRQAKANEIPITPEAAQMIAVRSSGMPRRICNILERATSYLTGETPEAQNLTVEVLNQLLSNMEIDAQGLDSAMRGYLHCLHSAPGGRLSVQSLASMLGSDVRTLELLVEPVLMKDRLVVRGSGGRTITEAGRALLGHAAQKFDIYMSAKRQDC